MLVKVTSVRVDQDAARQTLRGMIDGVEATFSVRGDALVAARGEPFLAVALLSAMASGETLQLDDSAPLDPALVGSLPTIQAILAQWNPTLHRVEIECSVRPSITPRNGVLSSFSAGVDSSTTLIEREQQITHLLTINGFDAQSRGPDLLLLEDKMRRIADALSKQLVIVDTNIRDVCAAFSISWNMAHGPVLCLLASALSFERFFIPASATYRELKPWGSHLVLDPLWSTSTTQIIHDGAQYTRTEKTAIVAQHKTLLSELQVCWKSQVTNCGGCSKCARTMLALNTLGHSSRAFPNVPSEKLINLIGLKTALSAGFAHELVDLLTNHGQVSLAKALKRRVRRSHLRQQTQRLVKDWVGVERISRLRRWRYPNEVVHRVRVLDPDDPV